MNSKESLKKEVSSQEASHLAWLQSLGFDIGSLEVGGWIKCAGNEKTRSNGAFAYKTWINDLREGGQGMLTRAKVHDKDYEYKTLPSTDIKSSFFRLSLIPDFDKQQRANKEADKHKAAAQKAYGFWQHSLTSGASDYLDRKGVGYYGIRFRDNQYGRVAVVPICDIDGSLWNYQLLNSDSKLFSPNGRTEGLFHSLSPLIDGKPIGLAESYVTAATCFELIGISSVCAFTCHNLMAVAKVLSRRYPKSSIVILADNDRHLETNQGLLRAIEAIEALECDKTLAAPDFGDYSPSKSASDWNDLVRLKGKAIATQQLKDFLSRLGKVDDESD